MSTTLIVAPHPDDETLGCGGTLLREAADGNDIHWLIVTAMPASGYDAARIAAREIEIEAVSAAYGFKKAHRLGFPTATLDSQADAFRPNLFVDISPYLAQKIKIMRLYQGELGEHPFPRSIEALNASAVLRGPQCNCAAAEAFMVIREIRKIDADANT